MGKSFGNEQLKVVIYAQFDSEPTSVGTRTFPEINGYVIDCSFSNPDQFGLSIGSLLKMQTPDHTLNRTGLVVLDEVQRGVESNIDYGQFVQLLKTAKAEIEILKQNSNQNPCFTNAVKKCFASYEIARKAWKRKMEAKDEKRKEDMEMTLAFSLSFSALNIKKANKCYE